MLSSFQHIYIDNKSQKTLVLLHGTGGDEYDLVPLVENYQNKFNILSLRGNVSENGLNRFFARHTLGVFDQKSIQIETQKFNDFIKAFVDKYLFYKKDLIYIGYSNGANMILATMFYFPELFNKVVLLHGMTPFEPEDIDLSHIDALVTCGEKDQMITSEQSKDLEKNLKDLGAQVEVVSHPGGHEIRTEELEAIEKFLK